MTTVRLILTTVVYNYEKFLPAMQRLLQGKELGVCVQAPFDPEKPVRIYIYNIGELGMKQLSPLPHETVIAILDVLKIGKAGPYCTYYLSDKTEKVESVTKTDVLAKTKGKKVDTFPDDQRVVYP